MRTTHRILVNAALLQAVLLTEACTTVGPYYGGPPPVAVESTSRAAFLRADSATTADAPVARWWESLNDPALNRVVESAIADSPTLAVANARISQARAALAATRTAVLPTIAASATVPYVNIPGGLLDPDGESGGRDDLTAYNVGFDTSWELDLFGASRRQTEASYARTGAAEAGLADAQVTLSAEVARTYVALRARQETLALLDLRLAAEREMAALANQRRQAGTAPEQVVAQQRAQLAVTEAELARTRAEAVVLADQLAVLAGREPGAMEYLLASPGPVPAPPASVPIGDPALLLRQRPDIRLAERNLATASADVGVKTAAKFPRISFLGLLGMGGRDIGDVVDPSSIIGLALPRLSWTLFDGGRAERQVDAARGAYAEAEARYRGQVLAALQDAESALARFGAQRIALGRAIEAQRQATTVASLEQQRARAGRISRANALVAERQRIQQEITTASARAELTTGFIAVEKSLGLGWITPPPSRSEP